MLHPSGLPSDDCPHLVDESLQPLPPSSHGFCLSVSLCAFLSSYKDTCHLTQGPPQIQYNLLSRFYFQIRSHSEIRDEHKFWEEILFNPITGPLLLPSLSVIPVTPILKTQWLFFYSSLSHIFKIQLCLGLGFLSLKCFSA